MENYTKVKLNLIIQQFEIQTVLKLLCFNEEIEWQDLLQFQVKVLLEIYSTFPIYSKALNLDKSVHFCLSSPYCTSTLKVNFSLLQGRLMTQVSQIHYSNLFSFISILLQCVWCSTTVFQNLNLSSFSLKMDTLKSGT